MKVQIYFLTRDYRLLFALTVLILGVGILLGIRLSGTAAAKGDYSGGDPEAAFREMLAKASSPEGEPVEAIAGLLRFFASEDEDTFSPLLSRELAASPRSPARRQLYSAYWNSITSLSGKPNAYLLTLAYRQQ